MVHTEATGSPNAPHSSSPSRSRQTRPLSQRRPDLVAQWDTPNNPGVCLDDHSHESSYLAWWICPFQHRWQATIRSRCRKQSGCRRCTLAARLRHHISFPHRRLSTHSPEIAASWHPTKNGQLTPNDVTFSSRVRVWWSCPSNPHHVWCTTVNNRQRSGCPLCAGRYVVSFRPRIRATQTLDKTHGKISKLWHPTLNGLLKPTDVTAGSKRIVWWNCPRNPEHIRAMTVYRRTHFDIICSACRLDERTARTIRRTNRSAS
jgi:hypothetical protein